MPGWHSAAYVRALFACRADGIPVLYRGDTHLLNAPAGARRVVWRAKNRVLLRLFDGYLAVGSRAREFLTTPVYRRERLRAGHRLAGPAIVEQMDSTTVILGGQEAVVDARANLVIHVGTA